MSRFEKQAIEAIRKSNSDYFKNLSPNNQDQGVLDVPAPSTFNRYQAKLDELKNNNLYAQKS